MLDYTELAFKISFVIGGIIIGYMLHGLKRSKRPMLEKVE